MRLWFSVCCGVLIALTGCGDGLGGGQFTPAVIPLAKAKPNQGCWQELAPSADDSENPVWFETPCDGDLEANDIKALHRALQIRGDYSGPITSEITKATRMAIRAFQARQGLDSDRLSLAAARQLGVVAFDVET